MIIVLMTRLAQWWAVQQMYAALTRLDDKLLADLGVEREDLPVLARRVAQARGPVSIYQLIREEDEPTGAEKACEAPAGDAVPLGGRACLKPL